MGARHWNELADRMGAAHIDLSLAYLRCRLYLPTIETRELLDAFVTELVPELEELARLRAAA